MFQIALPRVKHVILPFPICLYIHTNPLGHCIGAQSQLLSPVPELRTERNRRIGQIPPLSRARIYLCWANIRFYVPVAKWQQIV